VRTSPQLEADERKALFRNDMPDEDDDEEEHGMESVVQAGVMDDDEEEISFTTMMADDDDPLALLYLIPGAINGSGVSQPPTPPDTGEEDERKTSPLISSQCLRCSAGNPPTCFGSTTFRWIQIEAECSVRFPRGSAQITRAGGRLTGIAGWTSARLCQPHSCFPLP